MLSNGGCSTAESLPRPGTWKELFAFVRDEIMGCSARRTNLEFGDYQTPAAVTRKICKFLADQALAPATVIEPTCGVGNFLRAALDQFPTVSKAVGIEINPVYADRLTAALQTRP